MDTTGIIREFYNASVLTEWERIGNRPEFLLTCRFIDRYIRPGERVVDIGGGPGRYSLRLARRGADVTLLDLAPENVRFALEKAEEQGVSLRGIAGDARDADTILSERFDHVLLMGPMYHLLKESERVRALEAALNLLKPGGIIYVSFINLFAGIIYAMKFQPDIIADPAEQDFHRTFIEDRSFSGAAFTQAYLARQAEILPFMARFPLEKLHFFAQEGITSPCERNIMSASPEIIEMWLDLCEKTCEREELLSWGEHLMYIGKKNDN